MATGAQLVKVEARGIPPGRLVAVEYTDPYSIWCWGLEPAIRRLEVRYADRVEVQVRMGGLFEDFAPMKEYWTRTSGGRWKESVHTFMSAVEAQHRMPMDPAGMLATIDEFRSTWPACIAVKAAERQGTDAGRRYLRRLREGAVADGRAVHRRTVQLEIAKEVGLDAAAFEGALDDGSAERAFHEDVEECRSLGISGFPTMELRRGYVSVRLDGYHPWRAVDDALRGLDPQLRPRPLPAGEDSALEVLRRYGRCATREVAAVFGVTDDEADLLMDELAAKGRVLREEAGAGLFWTLPATPDEAQPPDAGKSSRRT